jgi:hypothetical protein
MAGLLRDILSSLAPFLLVKLVVVTLACGFGRKASRVPLRLPPASFDEVTRRFNRPTAAILKYEAGCLFGPARSVVLIYSAMNQSMVS